MSDYADDFGKFFAEDLAAATAEPAPPVEDVPAEEPEAAAPVEEPVVAETPIVEEEAPAAAEEPVAAAPVEDPRQAEIDALRAELAALRSEMAAPKAPVEPPAPAPAAEPQRPEASLRAEQALKTYAEEWPEQFAAIQAYHTLAEERTTAIVQEAFGRLAPFVEKMAQEKLFADLRQMSDVRFDESADAVVKWVESQKDPEIRNGYKAVLFPGSPLRADAARIAEVFRTYHAINRKDTPMPAPAAVVPAKEEKKQEKQVLKEVLKTMAPVASRPGAATTSEPDPDDFEANFAVFLKAASGAN